MSDWYSVSRNQVKSQARGLFRHHNTVGELLQAVYPDYPWDLSKFHMHGYWEDETNMLAALEKAEKQLGIDKVRATSLNTIYTELLV